MENQRMDFICHSCGKRIECSQEEPPCEVLEGWLTISHWKGLGTVKHYSFCSFVCLKSWADAQVPEVPEAFLESFEKDKG